MTRAQLVQISKLMAFLLRHRPDAQGLVLDAEGFTPLVDLVAAIQKEKPETTEEDIRAVVHTIDAQKQRYSIVDDEIRANYGHSHSEKIRYKAAEPPALLLHGTAEAHVPTILADGLKPMKRQYVHLTTDRVLALSVGSRHGKPRILCVDARSAWSDGVAFYPGNQTFWLADFVPAKYVSMENRR